MDVVRIVAINRSIMLPLSLSLSLHSMLTLTTALNAVHVALLLRGAKHLFLLDIDLSSQSGQRHRFVMYGNAIVYCHVMFNILYRLTYCSGWSGLNLSYPYLVWSESIQPCPSSPHHIWCGMNPSNPVQHHPVLSCLVWIYQPGPIPPHPTSSGRIETEKNYNIKLFNNDPCNVED